MTTKKNENHRTIKVCSTCGSDRVFFDAWVGVNDPSDILTFDTVFCNNCDGESSLTEKED